MTNNSVPSKDPENEEHFFFVWCDLETGLNDGSEMDDGELQGATIASYELTIPDGITKISDHKNAVTIKDVSYAADTVVTVKLAGGTVGTDYELKCAMTDSNGEKRVKRMTVPVRYG